MPDQKTIVVNSKVRFIAPHLLRFVKGVVLGSFDTNTVLVQIGEIPNNAPYLMTVNTNHLSTILQ